MKQKLIIMLLTACMALSCTFAFAACGLFDPFTESENGQSTSDQEEDSQTEEHEWSNWNIIQEASCEEDGLRERTCSICGASESQVIPATDHSFDENNVCSICGYELSSTLGLDYEEYQSDSYPYDTYYLVTGIGRATDTEIVIPAYHAGIAVKGIAEQAFRGQDLITSLYIPRGVEIIGEAAFSYCISLEKIILSNSIDSIEDEAFLGCNKLTEIDLGAYGITIGQDVFTDTAYYSNILNWEDGVLYIGAHLIDTNDTLPAVYTVKSGTRSIAAYAFAHRSRLTEITLPEAYAGGENVFSGSGITKATTHSSNVSMLPQDTLLELLVTSGTMYDYSTVLSNFKELQTLNIQCSISHSRYGCDGGFLSGLESLVDLTLPSIDRRLGHYFGEDRFTGSIAIEQAYYDTRDEKLTDSTDTYYFPETLRKVTILSGEIYPCAFWNCSILTDVIFSSEVTRLGEYIFVGCSQIDTLNFAGNLTQWCELERTGSDIYLTNSVWNPELINRFLVDGQPLTGEITIPNGITTIKFVTFYNTSISAINLPNSVTSIEMSAFFGCKNLINITIPDSVTSIGERAFSGCSNLASITIPDSVSSIGEQAFSGCSSLTSITIPDNVTSIEDFTFAGCSSLTSVIMPDSVTSIGGAAFSGCSSLANIELPDSVISIGSNAFDGCSSLTSIEIPKGVTSIGWHAFEDCDSLTRITIPNSVTSIGGYAFSGCSSLISINVSEDNVNYASQDGILYNKEKTQFIYIPDAIQGEITIPGSVTSIGAWAFYGCSGLTNVTIGNGVTSIGVRAFYDCSGLTSITIPDGVTSIEDETFEGCSSLTSITIPDSVISIGSNAFNGCSSLTSIEIPGSVTSIGGDAFYQCGSLEKIIVASSNPVYHSVGNCLIETESKTLILGCTNSVIPTDGSVTSIGRGAFAGCSSLTSITIPASITSIGFRTFRNCNSLNSVVFENTEGWTVAGKPIDVTDPAQNAAYFTDTFWHDWTRSE